jgi:hypothetical protein
LGLLSVVPPSSALGSGAALSFDGTDNYVRVGTGLFPGVTNTFTMEFWAKPAAARADTLDGTAQRYALFPDQGQLAYGSNIHAGAGVSVGTNGVSLYEHSANYLARICGYGAAFTNWIHVAVTYSNALPQLYVNGQKVAIGGVSGRLVHPSANMGEAGVGYGYYQGVLAEVRLWASALDQATIQAWMNRGVAPTHSAYASLIGYWHLDEGSGITAADSSGYGHNGTLINGPLWLASDAPTWPAVAVTLPASNVLAQSATFNSWVTPHGPATTAWFQWGQAGFTDATVQQSAGAGQVSVPISQPLGGLLPDTTYHVRSVASNSAGLYIGYDQPFKTAGPPVAQTQPAVGVSSTAATLAGTVNADGLPTTAWFEWGTNTAYGQLTPLQALSPLLTSVSVTSLITGLAPNVQYDYRLVVTNSSGTSVGTNQSFWTPGFSNVLSWPGILFNGSVAWGDYNRDGNLDLLVTGTDWTNAYAILYTASNGGLSLVPPKWDQNSQNSFASAGLRGVKVGAGAWGDFDNDGALDVLVTGYSLGFWFDADSISRIYRNANGEFTNLNVALPGLGRSAAACADYNNDGYLDFFLTGSTTSSYSAPSPTNGLYRNNGDGTFTLVQAGIPAVFDGAVAWGDFDNDGQLDLAIMGNTGTNYITRIYRNDHGVFTDIGAGLPGVCCGSVAWGDYDNDGQLDLLLVGQTSTNAGTAICRIYRNDHGVFTNIAAGLPGVFSGAAAWGDVDGDGKLDIALIGGDNASGPPSPYQFGGSTARVFRNNNDVFTEIQAGLYGVSQGGVAWGDFDNDGRLDLALLGFSDPGLQIYRNLLPQTTNNLYVPSPPTSLTSSVLNNRVTLNWNAGSDSHTPAPGLTYNLRVGTNSGGEQIVPAHSSPLTGWRRVAQMGNAEHRLFATLTNLPLGVFYCSVQAVNNSFAGSAWAPEQTFAVTDRPPVADTLPATNILCCSALLNGAVNPGGLATRAWYEWGATTNFGNTITAIDIPAGTVPQAAPQALTNLQPLTTYFFRLNATNVAGAAVGTNQSFTTQLAAPIVATAGSSNVAYSTATLLGISPFSSPVGDYFIEWGLSTNYGNSIPVQVLGAALRFDGVDDVVAMGWGRFGQVTNNFTIELWANPAASRAPTPESVSGAAAATGQQYAAFPEQGAFAYGNAADAGAGLSIGTNGVSVAEHGDGYLPTVLVATNNLVGWTHVALVYSNHLPVLYLAGTLVRTGLVSGKIVHPCPGLGGTTNLPWQSFGPFAGGLQELRIWDVPLDPATIQAWKDRAVTTNHPAYAHLQGYWPLNEGGGAIAADLSPRGNNGQLLNGAYWLSGRGYSATVFAGAVAGLKPGTTYHFRAVALNSGGTTYGADQTFTTLQLPQIVTIDFERGPAYRLRCAGVAGAGYFVEGSTNLISWLVISNLVAGPDGFFDFLDTTATNLQARFYRLRLQ